MNDFSNMSLSNLLFFIFFGYTLFALLLVAIDAMLKRFLDTFAFEKSTCIKVTRTASFILTAILLFTYCFLVAWIFYMHINDTSNMNEVLLILGLLALLIIFTNFYFNILPGRRN